MSDTPPTPPVTSYYLVCDATGTVLGSGSSHDNTLPAHAVACTQAQAAAPMLCTVSDGVVTMAPTPPQSLAAQATAALAAPFSIISPLLAFAATDAYPNGVPFAVDMETQFHILAELSSLSELSTFADNGTTIGWPDAMTPSNTYIMSIAQFQLFAGLIRVYTAALFKCKNGTLTSLPAPFINNVT